MEGGDRPAPAGVRYNTPVPEEHGPARFAPLEELRARAAP